MFNVFQFSYKLSGKIFFFMFVLCQSVTAQNTQGGKSGNQNLDPHRAAEAYTHCMKDVYNNMSSKDTCKMYELYFKAFDCILNHPEIGEKEKNIIREGLPKTQAEYREFCGGDKLTKSNGLSTNEITTDLELQRQQLVFEIQTNLGLQHQQRQQRYDNMLEEWKDDISQYTNMEIGTNSESFSYEQKNVTEGASERTKELLRTIVLDDESFDNAVIVYDKKTLEPISKEYLRKVVEDAEESQQEKTEEEICKEKDDHYKGPSELRVDSWNNPVNEQAFMDYIKGGTVLYSNNGLKLTYMIKRALTEDGLSFKLCKVGQTSGGPADRNPANEGAFLKYYNIYWILENDSEYTVTLKSFPTVHVSMKGDDTFSMCDEFQCCRSDRFGSLAVTESKASPRYMEPFSQTYGFEGAWHTREPIFHEWELSRLLYFDKSCPVFTKPEVITGNKETGEVLVKLQIADFKMLKSTSETGVILSSQQNATLETSDMGTVFHAANAQAKVSTIVVSGVEAGKVYFLIPFSKNKTGICYGAATDFILKKQ